MAKRKPVVWCRPLVCGQRYDVILASSETCPHLEGRDEASTVAEATTIAIRQDLSDERKEDCLAHELFVHALLEATGVGRLLRLKYGMTEEVWEAFEEDMASTYAPALLATLKTNGWLTLPALPAAPSQGPALAKAAKRSRTTKRKAQR